MSDSLRNRLIGVGIFLPGLVWVVVSPDFSEGIDLFVFFLAGGLLGAGGVLMVTGESLWDSDRWWALQHPKKRRYQCVERSVRGS